ncbi:MAG: LysM peptidoglycan-binding domain-containing protein, partial [Xanthomonadaceae bacterium]|nr:LysM peptidoglycan-binding domain-containing protein [Xanthomonadaceae bacterium]
MKRWIILIALLIALPMMSANLAAQNVEVRQDHPDEYVVREGDTLWDIAGKFLTRPWQWPAIWQANPQIDNPHLIYPGDRISMVYIDGQPRLVLDSQRRLSPEIRRADTSGPITTVPLSAIKAFLVKPRVVGPQELAGLPYVVANEDMRKVSAEPYRAFVRGLEQTPVGQQVAVARLSYQFQEVHVEGRATIRQNRMRGNLGAVPSDQRPIDVGARRLGVFESGGKVVGYQLWEVARGEVLAAGDPATVQLIDADMEVSPGDYILPLDPYLYDLTFFPRAPDFEVPAGASVIGLQPGAEAISHYQIAALDVGTDHGVEPGHTFSVFHRNRRVRDDFVGGLRGRPAPTGVSGRSVQLPNQYIGQFMVFRAFERV